MSGLIHAGLASPRSSFEVMPDSKDIRQINQSSKEDNTMFDDLNNFRARFSRLIAAIIFRHKPECGL